MVFVSVDLTKLVLRRAGRKRPLAVLRDCAYYAQPNLPPDAEPFDSFLAFT
jgi:hypothetical protein